MGRKNLHNNYMLGSSGVMRWSSSAAFGKKARYRWAKPGQKAAVKPAAKPSTVEKQIGGKSNGGTRVVPAFKRMVSQNMVHSH